MTSTRFLSVNVSVSFASLTGLAWLIAAAGPMPAAAGNPPMFSPADDAIAFEDRSRRKFTNAVIVDLDQNGHLDILITEHGQRVRLYWNEGGTFSDEPQHVVHGDTHGIAVGDYDEDGRIDLVISQGGGDGSNPRNPVWFQANPDRSLEGGEQYEELERSRGRAAKLFDADNDGTLELLHTGFPLKSQPDGANILYRHVGDGRFEFATRLPQAKWMGFKALVTDFDNDGVFDVLFYGGDNIVAARGGSALTFTDASREVLGDAADTGFVRSITEIDFDNDGDFDLFLPRADHDFDAETHFDPAGRRLWFFARREPIRVDDLTIEGPFELRNLQMAYPHFDVFAGSDKRLIGFDVERHGHKDLTLQPGEAEGWPDDTADPGLYIGHLGDGVWRLGGETDSPTAGVILNVASTPTETDPPDLPAVLLENRDGTFVDVTHDMGIDLDERTTGAAAGDFNNDGWSDLFVVRYSNAAMPTEQALYLNRGGEAFERAEDHGLVSPEIGSTGGGAEAFDYDRDGDLDLIFYNERGRWHLFTNNTPAGDASHYLVVDVGRSPTGAATALGAMLTLEACGRTYRRVVGSSSDGFSHGLDTFLHVGLGTCDRVDRATIRWTSGETQELQIDAVDTTVPAGVHDQP